MFASLGVPTLFVSRARPGGQQPSPPPWWTWGGVSRIYCECWCFPWLSCHLLYFAEFLGKAEVAGEARWSISFLIHCAEGRWPCRIEGSSQWNALSRAALLLIFKVEFGEWDLYTQNAWNILCSFATALQTTSCNLSVISGWQHVASRYMCLVLWTQKCYRPPRKSERSTFRCVPQF